MKYLVFSQGTWVNDSGWKTPVSVYNRVEVDDSKESLTKDDIDIDSMQEQLSNEYFVWKDGVDYYYKTTLENEDGESFDEVSMWLSDYRKKKIAIANAPEKTTRYMICEMNLEIYPKNKYDDPKKHLHEGVVREENYNLEEFVIGIYNAEEQARKAFEKYQTEIYECGSGVKGLHVTEYYLYERTFDLKRVLEDEAEVISEEDFDKQLKEHCFHFNEFDYSSDPYNCDGDVLDISPMNIVVAVFDEENIMDTEKYVLFHNYNDAAGFENEFLDNCDSLDGGWMTKMYFNSNYVETISEEEFKDWFKDYNDLEAKKKQEVKCRL